MHTIPDITPVPSAPTPQLGHVSFEIHHDVQVGGVTIRTPDGKTQAFSPADELSRLRAEVERLKGQLKFDHAVDQKVNAVIDAIPDANSDPLWVQIPRWIAQRDEARAEVERLTKELGTLKEERSDIEDTLNAANVEVFASPNEDGDELPFTLPERVEQLRNMLQSAQHDVRTLQGEVVDLRKERDEARRELADAIPAGTVKLMSDEEAREQGRQEAREGIAAELAGLSAGFAANAANKKLRFEERAKFDVLAGVYRHSAHIARNWKPEVQS
jgi:hypothetical protein